ncbi:MAG: hybrid sensor histidine kinase/response regulator [Cyanobacteria bacterium P01_A01_bin.45]
MTKQKVNILLVEDSSIDAGLICQIFLRAYKDKWQITQVDSLERGINACNQFVSPVSSSYSKLSLYQPIFDVVILDLHLPDSRGLETLKRFRNAVPNIPVIVLTNLDNDEVGIQAMIEGAQDYLVKEQITIKQLIKATLYTLERDEILQHFIEKEELARQELYKQQEANELRHSFVAMLSHEFRTPMTTIQTSVDILEVKNTKISKEAKTKHFQRINNALKQMVNILDEILFLYQAEVNKVEYKPKTVELDKFCHEIVEIVQLSTSNEPAIYLDCQLTNTQFSIDEELLTCIITNLLSNAVKYSSQESEINFKVNCDRDSIVFTIEDQGIGIPLEDQGKLFDTFYRASNVGEIKGTGLGLAVVKRCVDLHQGSIQFKSQEGLGTTFTVRLPVRE